MSGRWEDGMWRSGNSDGKEDWVRMGNEIPIKDVEYANRARSNEGEVCEKK